MGGPLGRSMGVGHGGHDLEGRPGWVPCRWQEVTVVESRRLPWAFDMLF